MFHWKRTHAAALTAVLSLAPALLRAQSWQGDLNVLLAGKHLETGDWQPTENEGEFGLQTNWQGPQWPVAAAVDLLWAGKDASIAQDDFRTQRSRTTEADLGVRKMFRPDPRFRPYVGGGLAIATGRLELSGPEGTISDEDSGLGLWLGGGLAWTLGKAFNLGVDAKISHADVRLFNRTRNAGGFHLGLLLGYHWGS